MTAAEAPTCLKCKRPMQALFTRSPSGRYVATGRHYCSDDGLVSPATKR